MNTERSFYKSVEKKKVKSTLTMWKAMKRNIIFDKIILI